MSFLGLEEPVQYTGYQIFDPTMAKMILDALDKYFNAVYADYQQGLEDMKEFKKEYYDFDTPILADLDWYNRNVTGKVRNFINDAYARGIDLTRSPEGRAAIALMINSVDVGKVAKLRSSKLAAEDYIKARGVLQSKGLYSPEMENFVTGGRSLENWNTLGGDGIWNRTSPIEAASLLDLTYDYYKNRTPRDLTAADFIESNGLNASMFDPKYQYSGYLNSDLLNNAQGAALGIANDPRAAYFRELAKQKVIARGEDPTQDAINSLFYRDIADANKWALVNPTKKADEFAVLQQLLQNTLASQRHSKALDNYYKMIEDGADLDGDLKISPAERQYYSMMKMSGAGGYSYDPSTGMMVSPSGNAIEFTDYRRMSSDVNRATLIQLNTASYILQMIDKEQADIDLYNKYLEENRTGIRKGETQQGMRIVTTGGAMSPGNDTNRNYEYTPTTKTPKHSEAEMSKLRKRAQAAKFMVDMYKSYLNEDGTPNYKKLQERGYFDESYQPTEKFMNEINKLNKNNSSLPEPERRKKAEDTYMLYAGSAPQPGTEAHKRLLKDFAGENLVKVPGLPNLMLKINFNHYKLSTIRRGDSTGANVYEKGSMVRKAQEWLQNNKIEGYVDDTIVNDAWIPNARGTSMQNDNFGEALVDKRHIDRMMNAIGVRSESQRKQLLDQLGIMEYEKQSDVSSSSHDTDYEWITYYSVPITKTITSGIIQGDRNIAYNKGLHGQELATKRERQSYAAGVQSTLTGQ